MPFAFQLGQTVTKSDGYTTAKVIGRAEFNYCENRYQVLRQDGDKTVQEWWDEGRNQEDKPGDVNRTRSECSPVVGGSTRAPPTAGTQIAVLDSFSSHKASTAEPLKQSHGTASGWPQWPTDETGSRGPSCSSATSGGAERSDPLAPDHA